MKGKVRPFIAVGKEGEKEGKSRNMGKIGEIGLLPLEAKREIS